MLHLVIDDVHAYIASFMKRSPRVGKAYFYQSVELISISRELVSIVRAEKVYEIREVIEAIEVTFSFVSKAKSKTLEKADEAIESTKEALKNCVVKHKIALFTEDEVRNRMQDAKRRDDNAIHRKIKVDGKARDLEKLGVKKARTTTEVFVYGKPQWDAPEVFILKKLTTDMSLDAVLFRLVELKLVKLQFNPHFYRAIPPIPSDFEYLSSPAPEKGGLLSFADPLAKIVSNEKGDLEVQLHILLDRRTRIFLDGQTSRVFGNVWEHNGRIFLKDVRGHLLEADQIRDEYQMSEGSEVEVLPSTALHNAPVFPIPALRYRWKDVLQEAKTAKKDLVFRPILAPKAYERIDSGYGGSKPASPVSPVPPTHSSFDLNPYMPMPSASASSMSNPTPMPVAQPHAATQSPVSNPLYRPSHLRPPLLSGTSSSNTSYHSVHEYQETQISGGRREHASVLVSAPEVDENLATNSANVYALQGPKQNPSNWAAGTRQRTDGDGIKGTSSSPDIVNRSFKKQTSVAGTIVNETRLLNQSRAASHRTSKDAVPVERQRLGVQYQHQNGRYKEPVQVQTTHGLSMNNGQSPPAARNEAITEHIPSSGDTRAPDSERKKEGIINAAQSAAEIESKDRKTAITEKNDVLLSKAPQQHPTRASTQSSHNTLAGRQPESSHPIANVPATPTPNVAKGNEHTDVLQYSRYGHNRHEVTNPQPSRPSSIAPSHNSMQKPVHHTQNARPSTATTNANVVHQGDSARMEHAGNTRSSKAAVAHAVPIHSAQNDLRRADPTHLGTQTVSQTQPDSSKKRKGWFTRVVEKVKDSVGWS